VAATVDLHQVREVDTGIDLGGRQRAVTEELLDGAEIHACLQKVGGIGVAEGVRVEVVEVGGSADGLVEEAAYGPVSQSPTTLVDKHWLIAVPPCSPPTRADGQVAFEGGGGWTSKGDQSLFAPLAANAQHPLAQVEIIEVERYQLAYPQTRAVKKLEDRAVAPPRRSVGKPIEQFLDGITSSDFGSLVFAARMGNGLGRVGGRGSLCDQESEVGAQGRKRAGDGARRQPPRMEVGKVGAHRDCGNLAGRVNVGLIGDEVDKGQDLSAIGLERRGG
jgi:hypothetical protein